MGRERKAEIHVDDGHDPPPQRSPEDIAALQNKTLNGMNARDSLDRRGIICETISFGSKIFHIAEHLVGSGGVVGGSSLVFYRLKPVRIFRSSRSKLERRFTRRSMTSYEGYHANASNYKK